MVTRYKQTGYDRGLEPAHDGSLVSFSDFARLEAENRDLREIVSKCCNALPNGAFCSPKASLDFMRAVPDEILLVTTRLIGEAETARAKLETVRAETLEEAAEHVESFSNSDHISRDIREGVFPEQSDIQTALAELLRSLKDKDQQNG